MHDAMSSERLWVLYGKKKDGQLSKEEQAELEFLLSAEGGYSLEIMDQLWGARLETVPEISMSKGSWRKIEEGIATEKRRAIPLYKWIAAAAAAVIIAASLYLLIPANTKINSQAPRPMAMNHVTTQNGSRTQLELPDGTKVWVNGSSRLSYDNKGFGTEERELYLDGEAYFDVAKNEKAPFIIHTGGVTITVLGTAFNVRAYSREKTVETSLIHGMVAITTKRDPDRRIILKPDEKIILPVDSTGDVDGPAVANNKPSSPYTIVHLRKDSTHTIPEVAWISPRLEFDNELLEKLAPKMERWFNVTIHFRDPAIARRRFSGVIEKETLQQTLEAMQLSGNFSYVIEGNELWIGSK